MLKRFVAFTGLTVCYLQSISQTAVITDSTAGPAVSNAITLYSNFIDNQSRLYNGNEHLGYPQRITGFAYYLNNSWEKGTVAYDGLVFKNVPMLYDLFKDQVIIQHFNEYIRIALINEKVRDFNLYGHHFTRIVQDSTTDMPLKTGFYDVLYKSNNLEVLAHRTKFIEEKVTTQLEQEFIEKNFYYIKKDGSYKTVKTYKSLLKIFPDRSKEIRRHLKKNKIKFRKDKETAIVQAVTFYDTPTN